MCRPAALRRHALIPALSLCVLAALTGCDGYSTNAAPRVYAGTPGDDDLAGAPGPSVYRVPRGGDDTIDTKGGTGAVLQLFPAHGKPLAEEDVSFLRDNADLVIMLGKPTAPADRDSVRIAGWFRQTAWPQPYLFDIVELAGAPIDSTPPRWVRRWAAGEVTALADPDFASDRKRLLRQSSRPAS